MLATEAVLQFASPEMRRVLIAQSAGELIRESLADIVKLAAEAGVDKRVVIVELMAASAALVKESDVETERAVLLEQFGAEVADLRAHTVNASGKA